VQALEGPSSTGNLVVLFYANKDQGQVSKLLARLAGLQLIENIGSGGRGTAKAWRLTRSGEALERATRDERLTPTGSRDAQDRRNS
jgi:hypothetical protein